MSLFKYFSKVQTSLPDPSGPLVRSVPKSSILAANAKVRQLVESESKPSPLCNKKTRGIYARFTQEQKARIGKYASQNGVTAAVRHFIHEFPALKENTVRDWRNAYQLEVKKQSRTDDVEVHELPARKRGRPLLLGEELDRQVQAYLTNLRECGGVVNTAIAMACAEGVVKSADANMLGCNGGHIHITRDWGKNILHRMGMVKRRASTKAKVSVDDFEELKEQFLLDIKVCVNMEDIPLDLVINWDQTGMHYVPVSSWTMAKEGSKRVEICGIDDKRQITAVFGVTMTGDFLPVQLIYQGKTPKCHPSYQFPTDWHITHSTNHWSNEETMKDYVLKILVPYIAKKRIDLRLSSNHHALVIYDTFKGQCTPGILDLLRENNIDIVFVPANCTDRLQPLDISVNKPAKNFMREQFQHWYADQIQLQAHEETRKPIDLKLSIVKPLAAKWFVQLANHLKSKPDIIKNGFDLR